MSTDERIVFKFDGENINTQHMGRDFIPLITNVYAIVQACTADEVRVVSIENNCIKFTLSAVALSSALLSFSDATCVLDVPKYNAAVKVINSVIKKRNASLELYDSTDKIVSRFDSNDEVPYIPEKHNDIKTTLVIYGELLDVGGASPNVHIKSDMFDEDVLLDVDKEDAKRLGQRLYTQIGVNANVIIRDGRVLNGRVLDIINYQPVDIEQWLEQNSQKVGVEAFRGIDINKFIDEQRI